MHWISEFGDSNGVATAAVAAILSAVVEGSQTGTAKLANEHNVLRIFFHHVLAGCKPLYAGSKRARINFET
jgi:hypothetical protein